MNFIFGLAAIAALIGVYAWTNGSRFQKEKKQEIKKDIAEFGQCCGLETGVCTYEPKIKKLNKQDIVVDTTSSTSI
jgi:hypothetical protein